MSLKVGIVGLPNVGKSTLFNAITKQDVLSANYPFATIEPNQGVVVVNDERLNKLNEMYEPKKLIPTAYEFTDIAGLVKGASKGEGLGNKFLSHIREVDAICEVVRCFDDGSIIHVENEVDPIRDVEIINVELAIADLDIINNRLEKIAKKVKSEKNSDTELEYQALLKGQEALKEGKPLRLVNYSKEEIEVLKSYSFLTIKPLIYLANVLEDDLGSSNKYVEVLKEYAEKEKTKVVEMCAKLENDLKDVLEEDKNAMFDAVGLKESGLDALIRTTYELLGLRTFFTVGKDEVRAWTFKDGMNAKECAGIIHTDFEKGFIKAEVMSYEDLIKETSELKVKEAGKLRIEGKDYLMKDGDICLFRFNV